MARIKLSEAVSFVLCCAIVFLCGALLAAGI
jgi:hypothetical protein